MSPGSNLGRKFGMKRWTPELTIPFEASEEFPRRNLTFLD